jgi:hypothetical protein
MSEWQPIETAPRDGTQLLLGIAAIDGAGGCVFDGWWEGGGWTNGELDYEDGLMHYPHVTHWMPLPSPPKDASHE